MIVLYIVVALVILFFALSALGPKTYAVDRTIVIDKPRADVYNSIKYLKSHDDWSPWSRRDPNIQQQYNGTDGEVGFTSSWQGNKDVGEGEQEIRKLVDNERIETELRFTKPWKSRSDAFIQLEDAGDSSTKVTWGFSGKNESAMMRIMGLFMNMDKMVGKDFEEGLASLKESLEQS